MSKKPTKAEQEHMNAVKQMDCIISGRWGVDIHHIKSGDRRLGHFFVLPLHPEYHRGRYGFDGIERDTWDKSLKNQLKLCAEVYEKLGKEMPKLTSKVPYFTKLYGSQDDMIQRTKQQLGVTHV